MVVLISHFLQGLYRVIGTPWHRRGVVHLAAAAPRRAEARREAASAVPVAVRQCLWFWSFIFGIGVEVERPRVFVVRRRRSVCLYRLVRVVLRFGQEGFEEGEQAPFPPPQFQEGR